MFGGSTVTVSQDAAAFGAVELIAFFSAIAAISAAAAAWLSYRTQQRTLIESHRPILVLDGWRYISQTDGHMFDCDQNFKLDFIRNVGNGHAYRCFLDADSWGKNHEFFAAMESVTNELVLTNADLRIGRTIGINWDNWIAAGKDKDMMYLQPKMMYFDILGNRYVTRYWLLVRNPDSAMPTAGAAELAENLYYLQEKTAFTSARRLRIRGALDDWPWIQRLVKVNDP